MTDYETDADIARLAEGFADLSLPKEAWTHAAHFATALWLFSTRGQDTYADMPGMIRRFNEAKGGKNTDTEGYHETITVASLRAAEHALNGAPDGETLIATLARLLAGPYGRSDWLAAYWSKERLSSTEARLNWVEPDLAPLPF